MKKNVTSLINIPNVNNMSSYVLLINNVRKSKKCNASYLIKAIKSLPGITLGNLTLADILQISIYNHGIYILEEGESNKMTVENPPKGIKLPTYWYIGKCTSRSFSDRLGGHLSVQPGHQFNNVLQRIAWILSGDQYKDFMGKSRIYKRQFHYKAADVMKKLRIKFICFDRIATIDDYNDVLEDYLKQNVGMESCLKKVFENLKIGIPSKAIIDDLINNLIKIINVSYSSDLFINESDYFKKVNDIFKHNPSCAFNVSNFQQYLHGKITSTMIFNQKLYIKDIERCLVEQLHPYLNDPLRGVFNKSTLKIIP